MPPMNSILAHFAEAARNKRVALIQYVGDDAIRLSMLNAGRHWAFPCLNFGQLDDTADATKSWSPEVWNETWAEGVEHVENGTFRLPFEECAYLFHYADNQQKYETVNLIHLATMADGILGETYIWQPSHPNSLLQGWTKHPFQFVIMNDGTIEWSLHPSTRIDTHLVKEYEADVKATYTKVICATMLLTHGAKSTSPSAYVAGVNNGRALGKLKPLPDTITIDLSSRYRSGSRLQGGFNTGVVRQPHDRRGHYRTLKSGKIIPVKASQIHGGSSQSRVYNVRGGKLDLDDVKCKFAPSTFERWAA
jgi:hypothetical protein